MSSVVVELNGLTKSFGALVAVHDVRAVAQPGQVTALLGPNGAGKTTTLRMLLGLVHPSRGTATFSGKRYDELHEPVRQVGAVLEASGYHPGRTALDHLRILTTAARLPQDAPTRVLAETELAADHVLVLAHGRLIRSSTLDALRAEAGVGRGCALVKALVHAELLKLRSTRTTTGLLLATLALTQEFRYGTVASMYFVEPRRTRVLVAKWLSLALAGVVVSIATLAVSVPFGSALIRSRGGDATVAAQFWQTVAAEFVVVAAYGIIGVAVGALIRNQITAVVGVLVWMLAVEQVVIPAFPAVGRWMPGGAAQAVSQTGRAIGLEGELLSAPVGGLVLAGYTATAVALALLITPAKDVL